MKPSENLMESLHAEIEKYPNFKERRSKLLGLKTVCDAIEIGTALESIQAKYGRNHKFTGKINTSSVELTRKSMGYVGPSRSTVNRDLRLKKYIELREEERLRALPVQNRQSSQKPQIDIAIRKLTSWEDQALLINAVHDGAEAERELRLLKRQLKKIPKLAISIDDLKGDKTTSNNTGPIASIEMIEGTQTLKRLYKRLTNNEEMSRFELTYCDNYIKEIYTNRVLVRSDELLALEKLIETLL